MSANLESSRKNEVKEMPEAPVDSEKLAKTEETADNFDDCARKEVRDSKGQEVSAGSLENAEETYEDCSAKVKEMEQKNPELAEDEDDFSDCGKKTEGKYVAEVTYTTDGEVSPEEAHAQVQEAYAGCDDPENMQQLKANANQNEHIQVQSAQVVERPAEVQETVTEKEYEAALEKQEKAREELEAQQEAAQEYQQDLENKTNKQEDEVPTGNEHIEAKTPQDEKVDETPQNEKVDETPQNEKVDETPQDEKVDETPQDEKVDETPQDEKVDKTPESEESPKETLQERVDKALENEEASPYELQSLKEEHAAAMGSKLEERDAVDAQCKSKFEEVLSKETGSEEYKQALQEYNALREQKAMLDQQVEDMKEQQSLLEKKAESTEQFQPPDSEQKGFFDWFKRRKPEATEAPVTNFGDYEVDSHGFVKGENYQSYIEDWEGYSADRYQTRMFDQAEVQTISPSLVEGIRVSDSDIENPEIFWSQHESGGTQESFEKIAANIPEVRDRLAAGESLNDLMQDPQLGRCASIYFHPDNMPEVIKCGDYYEFQSNGRHRILAARNLGYDIPVRVIGERTIEDADAKIVDGGKSAIENRDATEPLEQPETVVETEDTVLSEDAKKALEKMPEDSEFNEDPKKDISNALECYGNYPYGKGTEQYKAIQNHCHDAELAPLRNNLFQATERYNEQVKEVERIKNLVSDYAEHSDPFEAQQLRNEQLRAEFTLSMYQNDVNEATRMLSAEAEKHGVDADTAQRKFVGFHGNDDFSKAYDGYITGQQTGGTCGINYCASVINQQTGTRITQKEAVTEFAANGLCGESADINEFGGTNFYHRQEYFKKHALESQSVCAQKMTLEDMAKRFENGESIGIALHAQDLTTPYHIDAQSRQPKMVLDENGNVSVEVDDSANHMVTVAGFDRTPDGKITMVYINDTGGFNWANDPSASGGAVFVNRIPIPAEKYYAMSKNTDGMYVEFVTKEEKR